MKINKIQIFDADNNLLRNITFNLNGLSIIYANIEKTEDDSSETINSLGKTLLLKFIDFLFGCNNNTKYFKPEITDYIIKGVLVNEIGECFEVSRKINDTNENYINSKKYTIDDYKEKLRIRRDYLDKQLFLEEKQTLISSRSSITESDITTFLKLLNLDEATSFIGSLYKTNKHISDLENRRKSLEEEYKQNHTNSTLKEDIFLTEKKIEELEDSINHIQSSLTNLNLSDTIQNIYNDYTNISIRCTSLAKDISKKDIQIENLTNFLETTKTDIVTANEIQLLFEKAKIEVNSLITKKIHEVEEFHKIVYDERLEYLKSQLDEFKIKKKNSEADLDKYNKELDSLGAIISKDQAYQKAIQVYHSYSKDLNILKYQQGVLSESKKIFENIEESKKELGDNNSKIKGVFETKEYIELINSYRDFIYETVQNLYTEDIKAYFNIEIKKVDGRRKNPIEVVLNLTGDTGEGVGTIRKILIDILVFKVNKLLDIIILDSSCFSGVDPRQTFNCINIINNNGIKENKQAIITLNKYQLPNNKLVNEFIAKYICITLNEHEKLLNFTF